MPPKGKKTKAQLEEEKRNASFIQLSNLLIQVSLRKKDLSKRPSKPSRELLKRRSKDNSRRNAVSKRKRD
jgi:hypothetical protein